MTSTTPSATPQDADIFRLARPPVITVAEARIMMRTIYVTLVKLMESHNQEIKTDRNKSYSTFQKIERLSRDIKSINHMITTANDKERSALLGDPNAYVSLTFADIYDFVGFYSILYDGYHVKYIAKCEGATLTRSQNGDGYDLFCYGIEKEKSPTVALIKTGIAIELPPGYIAYVTPRSSISSLPIMIANSPGLIDNAYRGEILIAVRKFDPAFDFKSLIGISIAQLTFTKCYHPTCEVADILSDTNRGNGGFGSTGNTLESRLNAVNLQTGADESK
jgi:dUTP pyrophosphatase